MTNGAFHKQTACAVSRRHAPYSCGAQPERRIQFVCRIHRPAPATALRLGSAHGLVLTARAAAGNCGPQPGCSIHPGSS